MNQSSCLRGRGVWSSLLFIEDELVMAKQQSDFSSKLDGSSVMVLFLLVIGWFSFLMGNNSTRKKDKNVEVGIPQLTKFVRMVRTLENMRHEVELERSLISFSK